MEMKNCVECGTELQEGMETCPKCGCIVEQSQTVEIITNEAEPVKTETPQPTKMEMKVPASQIPVKSSKKKLLSLGLGIVMVIMGLILATRKADLSYSGENFSSGYHNVTDYSFGADFYTEIYEANNTIVDELNSIDGNVADGFTSISNGLSSTARGTVNAIYLCAGMITIALGLGTIALTVKDI